MKAPLGRSLVWFYILITSLFLVVSPDVVFAGRQGNKVQVSISPSTVSISVSAKQQFTASVSGTYNKSVTWSGTGGSVTTSGLYTAPATPGTYKLTATSVADPTRSATATVTVTSPVSVAIAISPTSASLLTGATQQFTASITGTTNTAVTWSASGGNVNTTGLYTAPWTEGTYKVSATSVADPTKVASATVTVSAPVSVSINPSSASLQTGATQQFTAFVSGTANTALAWSATGGTVSSTGLYVAPSTAGTYTVTATSVADTSKSARATVTVTNPPPPISVTISPSTASLATGGTQQFSASVAGTTSTGVTWSATGGTVSNTGLYTAPSTIGTYTIIATSAADTTKSASATITVSSQVSIKAIGGQNVGKQFNGSAPPVLAFPNNVAAGDQVIVTMHCYNPTAAPVINAPSRSSGSAIVGVFIQDGTASFRGGNYYAVKMFRAPIVAAGSLALSFSAANCYGGSVAMQEFQGIAGVDGSATVSTGTGSTESSGSLLTSGPGMVLMTSAEESSSDFTYSLSDTKLYSDAKGAANFTSETQFRMTTAGGTQTPLTAGTQNNWMWWALSVAYISAAGGSSTGSTVGITITPAATSLQTGTTQQFTTSVSGTTNTAVTWSGTGGSITTAGLYTAPSMPGTYQVTATSVADPTKSATAKISVTAPVTVSISPASTSLSAGQTQQFTSLVTGTSNTAVTWSATSGSITSSGTYTAPSSAGTYTVTASSVADPTKTASASISVTQGSTIAVSVSPSTASIQTGTTQQFTATVTGSTNSAVTWTSTGGSISTTGLYTAPKTPGTYTVTAKSVADTTKSAAASISVAGTQLLTVSPASLSFGSILVGNASSQNLTVSNTGTGSVTLSALNFTGGVFSSPGLSLPVTLSPGASKTISITFAPDISGAFQGSAAAVSNATNSPATATLSGTGVAPQRHSVDLSWTGSISSGVIGYYVYRSTSSGGGYTKLNPSALSTTTAYTDSTVQSGVTYYYVVTAVDSSNDESAYSNQSIASVPTP